MREAWKDEYLRHLRGHPPEVAARLAKVGQDRVIAALRGDAEFAAAVETARTERRRAPVLS